MQPLRKQTEAWLLDKALAEIAAARILPAPAEPYWIEAARVEFARRYLEERP